VGRPRSGRRPDEVEQPMTSPFVIVASGSRRQPDAVPPGAVRGIRFAVSKAATKASPAVRRPGCSYDWRTPSGGV